MQIIAEVLDVLNVSIWVMTDKYDISLGFTVVDDSITIGEWRLEATRCKSRGVFKADKLALAVFSIISSGLSK